ncbi:MAG: VCBS repeat-containing protein, partial [Lentisphaeria bacterium]|nr:VCBS repeat-containing protein [Lentisphaeria bacterium]
GASYAGIYFSQYYPKQPVGPHILRNLDALNEPNMRYWKVNEDCPGYGNITLTGNYDWALARPDNRFFELDCLRRMADYDLMISDNTARPSGYGDSSGLGGSYLVDAYSLASWIYKDGRYLWWYDKHGGKPNRFWTPPEVLPRVRPKELIGLSVAPLDDWIYNSRSARVKAETARERCFDKATFRAGLEEQDSYLCIGGFCYGFHSHPDANAIIRYADKGEVRLYDDGYMIPGLGEHNTVTILKDGWTSRTPDFAQVRLQSEFPDAGFFQSRLAGYNGVNWDRTVLWLDRRCFLVVDELACIDPGVYSFQCIWRALGVAKLEGRSWRVRGKKGVFELVAASDAALTQREPAGTSLNAKPMPPSRARALVEGAQKAMEPGDAYRYANVFRTADEGDAPLRAVPVAPGLYAIDTGGWQALAGIDQCATAGLSLRAGAFQITSRTLRAAGLLEWAMGDIVLTASIPADVSLDFDTGRLLARAKTQGTLTIRTKNGVKTLRITGEVQAVPALRLASDARARIAAAITQALLPKNAPADSADVAKSADLRTLWNYREFAVCADMSYTPGIACSTVPAPLPKDYVKHGTGDAATLTRPSANLMFPAGETVTATILLPQDMLLTGVVVKSRQLRTFRDGCGQRRITLRAVGADGTLHEIAVAENDKPLQNAIMSYALAGDEPFTARRLELIIEPYSPKHKVYLDSVVLEGIADRASVAASGFQINALQAADLDGDGKPEIVVGGIDRTVHALTGAGQALWTAQVDHNINAIAITRNTAGRTTQLAAACDDHKLYSFLPNGTENFIIQPPPRTYARPGYRGVKPFTGRLTVAVPGDLDGDGNQEIVIGSANWRAYVYSATGELLWDACCWAHTPTCATVADLDHNGSREVVMGNTYTSAVVYSSDGKVIGKGGGSGHAGPTAIATADLDGNGKGEIVVGDRAGRIWFSEFKGRPLPRHETGSEIADVVIADLDADGRLETIVVSRNFLIYIFDADGKPRNFRSLLTVCRDIAVGDVTGDGVPNIVCACDDGTVRVLDENLQTLAESAGTAPVRRVALADLDGDGRPEIISASDDATVSAFSYEGK